MGISKKTKEDIKTCYLWGLSSKDIAEIYGIKESLVRKIIVK